MHKHCLCTSLLLESMNLCMLWGSRTSGWCPKQRRGEGEQKWDRRGWAIEKGLEEGEFPNLSIPQGKGWALWAKLLFPGPQVLGAVVTGLWQVSWGQQLHCFLFGSHGLPAGRVSWAPQAPAAFCLFCGKLCRALHAMHSTEFSLCRDNIPCDFSAVVKLPPPAGSELADTRT